MEGRKERWLREALLWRGPTRWWWGKDRRLTLTDARSTREHGGKGRGDHGGALGKLGNAFLPRRGS